MSGKRSNSNNEHSDAVDEFQYTETGRDNAVRGIFDEAFKQDLKEFIEPITRELESDFEQSLHSTLQDKYEDILDEFYDAEENTNGRDIADSFIATNSTESAIEKLEEFEDWTENYLDDVTLGSSLNLHEQEFDNEKYKQGVKGYSVRKLVADHNKLNNENISLEIS